jgi:aminopeptidase N
MKKLFLFCLPVILALPVLAQDGPEAATDSAALALYREAAPMPTDLVHTRLEVRFDYEKSWMYGKAWITLKPHFYPTDSVILDAKGLDLHQVSLVKGKSGPALKYTYDGEKLHIHLDKTYHAEENYTVYIDYTSKPNERKSKGSAAIKDDKGLYFINPLGTDPKKPVQIWTQGESESNSCWFPTLDKPNQKSTEEIAMTVPDKYVTLSNGRLADQKKNADGTRTDYWKMDQPHAPYLFFMGVGDYAVIRDKYKDKEVNYYVEKEYEPVARQIFGYTPEMIAFYSRILGIDYPWVKYSQMTGRDYVSGAMENTTATLQTWRVQQDARELKDGNKYEEYVAHELFHQWFGDYVTTESWSNLTVNESFADLSETLWAEFKHGKDAGDAAAQQDLDNYLADPANVKKNLVRYHYADREDMFDMVTYSKGARILNMLRNYVGDSAFFRSLHLYLTSHPFGTGEADDLRQAFEKVTGQDMNWYWNQWYYGSGHPKLDISYRYDEAHKNVTVTVKQVQESGKIFRIPLAIDVYENGGKKRHREWLENETDTFRYQYTKHPDLVNVDGDKIVLCEKQDDKTLANYIFQYRNAGLYLDRREAIDFCAEHQDSSKAVALLKTALKDRYDGLRQYCEDALDLKKPAVKASVEPVLLDLAKTDSSRPVQAKAIGLLAGYHNAAYKPLFIQKTTDSSYSVAGNALHALADLDKEMALGLAEKFYAQPARGDLMASMVALFIDNGDTTKSQFIVDGFTDLPMSESKLELLPNFAVAVLKMSDDKQVEKGVDAMINFTEHLPPSQKKEFSSLINENFLKPIAKRKAASGFQAQADYINKKLGE